MPPDSPQSPGRRWPKHARRLIIMAGAIALGLYLLVVGGGGIADLYRARLDVRRMEADVARAHVLIDSLKVEIEKLKTDTSYLERIARERLGMARKNETVFKFSEER